MALQKRLFFRVAGSVVLREAWDGDQLRTLTKNSPTKATGAHVSLVGHVTKEELLRHLNETEQANGFAPYVYASVQNWFPRRTLLSSLVNRGKAAPGLL